MKNVTVHGGCVTAMLLCCLVSVAAMSGFLCNNKHLLHSCFFSVLFASLSAADTETDGDGKKRAAFYVDVFAETIFF